MKKQPKKKYLKFDQNEEKNINNFFQSLSFKKSLVNSPTKMLKKIIYTILENQNIVFDKKTNITIISTEYTLFVVHLLYKQLTKDGFEVQIKTTLPESFSNHLHIVICPQIFDRLPDHYIAFQMEQLESSKWFNERYRKILKNAIAIFDYSIQNLKYLHKNNAFPYKQLFFLPISFFEGYQQFLIQEGYWNSCKADTCDVLFYGSAHSERRKSYLEALQNKFSVKIIDGVFGNDLYMELLSAKVVVNIHYNENALLETTRLYECLSLGLSVVSEESIDMEEHSKLLEKIDFVRIGDIDHMISSIENILTKENNHAYPEKNAIEKQRKMKKSKLVSIIIPCYNQAHYLEETVQSVINQTYTNIEIIIINDGSTDNTDEIGLNLQKKFLKKLKIISQKNQGVSEARNNGIRESTGQYILPLDADDLIHKDMLSKCVETLEKYNVDIVYSDTKGFGSNNYTLIWKEFSSTNPLYLTPCNVTALYKKKVWEDISGYKVNMNMQGGFEDWEFWINAYKHGFLFQHHPEILFFYRTKKESRYTETLKKESYYRANILLNHPEMYIYQDVQEAISTIKRTDGLADYYFYSNQKDIENEKEFLAEIIPYIQQDTLQSKQILSILNKKIMLSEVSILMDSNFIKENQNSMKIDIFLFYSSVRYDIPFLYNCTYAWYQNKELRLAKGSIFPFIIRTPNDQYELPAYKHRTKYFETMLKEKEDEEILLKINTQKKATIISNRDNGIKMLKEVIEKQKILIENRNNGIKMLKEQVEKQKIMIKNRDNGIKNRDRTIKSFQKSLQENEEKYKVIVWRKGLMYLKKIYAYNKHKIKQSVQRNKNGN